MQRISGDVKSAKTLFIRIPLKIPVVGYVPLFRGTLEVTNALLAALRRKRISESEIPDLLIDLRQLPDEIDRETDSMVWEGSFYLAKQYGLSIYDATYLELALRKKLPIATLDKALVKASLVAGVEVLN